MSVSYTWKETDGGWDAFDGAEAVARVYKDHHSALGDIYIAYAYNHPDDKSGHKHLEYAKNAALNFHEERVSDRPEWASGPEWEGWEDWANGIVGRSLRESDGQWLMVSINGKGWLGIGVDEECREIATQSPAHALNAANALAESCGGWE